VHATEKPLKSIKTILNPVCHMDKLTTHL